MTAEAHKAGMVALIGRPNAGKSTLLNAWLKNQLSIVSSKPQTTRHKILGLLDAPNYQICFLDTPGLMTDPGDPLQSALCQTARIAARQDADIVVLLVEPVPPSKEELEQLPALIRGEAPVILAINKCDLSIPDDRKAAVARAWTESLRPAAAFKISALKRDGIDALLAEIVARLPESPAFYDKGQLSDRYERFFAAEIIRGQVFELYGEEIPHATAVMIEQYRESKAGDQIMATLYVERDGQKGIILGKEGGALRRLEDRARAQIENMTGRPAQLEIWVKVRSNWRKDPKSLKEFGYLG